MVKTLNRDTSRDDLRSLAGHTDVALGDSEYNRQELERLGFTNTGVFPIAVDLSRITAPMRRPALEAVLDDGLQNFLFVGRIAPNKKVEDIIRLAEFYKRYVDERYRFIFVSRTDGVPRYFNMVRALIAEFQMPPDRFIFTGPVPDDELAVYYRTASVYISLSEHEGFCVPLLEAMAADVPVLAYASSAVPDTLGGAGISSSFRFQVFRQCETRASRAAFTVRPFDKLSALRNIDGQDHGPECYRRANNEL